MNKAIRSKDFICAALDGFDTFSNEDELKLSIRTRLDPISEHIGWVKIGMELFYSANFDIIKLVDTYGIKIFLDLKLKDIAYNTIKNTSKVLASKKGVGMYNVHADGSQKMMQAAIEGAEEASQILGIPRPKIIGVTVLTSMNKKDLKEIGIKSKVEEQVLRLALLAQKAGLDGIVCSANDLSNIKSELPDNFEFVCPGIRSSNDSTDGQKRIATPDYAIKSGATLLVSGRPIYENKTAQEMKQTVINMNKTILPYI